MAKNAKKPIALTVLDAVQALAADITFAGGDLTVTGLGRDVAINDAYDYSYTAYSAGVASIKEYDFAAVTLLANHTYRFAVIVDCQVDFHGGGKEANELIPIREYVISTGTVIPTADDLKNEFITRIGLDPDARVTAASGGVGVLELTLISVDEGDFSYEAPAGTVETITTTFVAPAGTPTIVEEDRGQASPAGQYDTYVISFNDNRRHAAVTGGFVEFPEDVKIYFESTDGDSAAFIVAMNAILGGTHTPVSDYLGV